MMVEIWRNFDSYRLASGQWVTATGYETRIGDMSVANGTGSAVTVSGVGYGPDASNLHFFVSVPANDTVQVIHNPTVVPSGLYVNSSTNDVAIVVNISKNLGR